MLLAVYPGSFDPPTIAHLAIAEAALAHAGRLRLVLSERALGKEVPAGGTTVEVRERVLADATRHLEGVDVATTRAGLIVDIAEELGADAVVLGSDKWAQVVDPAWYGGSVAARDAALGRLPIVLLAPRDPATPAATPAAVPTGLVEVVVLEIPASVRSVSSTRARSGEAGLMVEAARSSGHWS